MVIPVCLASDRNYIQHLSVTMASILKNKASEDTIRFYILENAFTESDRQVLERLKSIADFEIEYVRTKEKLPGMFPMGKKDRLTIEAYFRLFIPELIPQEDKIIYLDCDIVVRHNLAELYSTDPGDHYVLGVRDIDSRGNTRRMGTKRYINSGVLLMNNKKMRDDGICDEFVRYILTNGKRIVWHDQDVIAAVLSEHTGYLSPVWNGQISRLPGNMKHSRLHDARILHYVGDRKPWLPYKDARFIEEYFKYLRLTPFADYEKTWRKHRLLWRLSRVPLALANLVFLKKTSRLRTYNTFRILGIAFRQKRRQRKKSWDAPD